MKTAVFLHEIGRAEALGNLEAPLRARGAEIEFFYSFDGALDGGFDALAPDLLIVMGGAPGAYQTDLYPFLRHEIAALEKRLAADLPTLGVCLGSQLMAAALGGRNYLGPNGKERGWYDINVNEAGMKTPLRHFDASLTKMVQSHQDTFDLPPGATLLASSAMYENQAFSWGRNALAVQFHPETTPLLMHNRITSLGKGPQIAEWTEQTKKYGPALVTQAEKFMNEWLEHIGQGEIRRHA